MPVLDEVLAANRAYADWLGLSLDALKGLSLQNAVGPESYQADLPFVEAALRGEPQSFERSLPGPDGTETHHFLAHYLPDVVDSH